LKHTDDEIKSYIESELTELNLDEKEKNNYFKYLKKINNYMNSKLCHHEIDVFTYVEEKLENLYAKFIHEGFTDQESTELSKNALLFSERQEAKLCLDFIRVANIEVEALKSKSCIYRRRMETAHAKKMHLVINGYTNEQNTNNIFKSNDNFFEKKFNANVPQLMYKYPITDELKNILSYLADFTDQGLLQELGITREQLSHLYPTTSDEVSTLKMLAKLDDEEIKERYGITREELLQKYPLNNDTLKALRSINQSSKTTINKIMNQTKDEVLHLRTITTEMIKQANQNFKLQKQQEIEKVKTMKKGTIN